MCWTKAKSALLPGASLPYCENLSSLVNKGLALQFAENGGFDVPESYGVGVAFKLTPALTVAADVERINYSDIASVGNPLNLTQPLGTAQGAGFGWQDINIYKVGATYNWNDKTDLPTIEGKTELIERINEIITCDFEIISHFAGVRPTVKDRRPFVGTHPDYKVMHVLNGLGTRGVMLGPAMAKALFNFIEFQTPLDAVIDIKRYVNKIKK